MTNPISIRHILLIKLMLGTAFASDHLGDSLPVPSSTSSTPAPVSRSSDMSSSSSSSSSYRLPAKNPLLGSPEDAQGNVTSYLLRSELSSLAQTSRGMKKLVDTEMPNSQETWVLDFSNAHVRKQIEVLQKGNQGDQVKLKLQNVTAFQDIIDLKNRGVLERVDLLDVEGLNLGNNGVMYLVKASPKLKSLNISRTGLTVDGAQTLAAELGALTELRELDISRNALGNDGVMYLVKASPKLKSLNISRTGLTANGIRVLAAALGRLTELRELDMSWNQLLGNVGVAEVVKVSPHLESLKIEYIGLTASGLRELEVELNRTQLRKLDISLNLGLGNGGVAAIVMACPYLVSLKICETNLTDRRIEMLAEVLGKRTQLRELDMSDNQLGNVGVAAVVQVFPNLVKLKATRTGLTAERIEIPIGAPETLAAALGGLTQLQELDISSNELSNMGVAEVVHDSPHLIRLNISNTGLTLNNVIGIIAAERGKFTKLRELNMSGNRLGSLGVARIVETALLLETLNIENTDLSLTNIKVLGIAFSKLTRLQNLNMSINKLGNVGVAEVVKASPHLVSLNIGYTRLTAKGIEALGTVFRNLTQLQRLVTTGFLGPLTEDDRLTTLFLEQYFEKFHPHPLMLNGRKLTPKIMSTTTTTTTTSTSTLPIPRSGSLMEEKEEKKSMPPVTTVSPSDSVTDVQDSVMEEPD